MSHEPLPRLMGCYEKTLRFSACGQLISPAGFVHHRRRFEENVLIMITEGTLCITANGVRRAVSAGQYILLPAGEEHYGAAPSQGRLSYLWAHFSGEFRECGRAAGVANAASVANAANAASAADIAGASDNAGFAYLLPETARLSDYGRSAQLFHQLMDLSLEERLYSQDMADYAVSLLMMELSQEYYISAQGAQRLPPAVASAREWIKNHCFRPFEMAELAAALGYSADYLSTLFKQCTGESVTRCANRLRISTAKTLLTNYGVTAKEAAYSCGFSDEKYFMRVFKQLEGLTPTQYKESFGKKNVN